MATNTKYCRKCGTPVSADTRFCPNCGYEFTASPVSQDAPGQQVKYCRQCGKANAASAKFCLYCGHTFDDAQPSYSGTASSDVPSSPSDTSSVSGKRSYKETAPKNSSPGKSRKSPFIRLVALVLIAAILFAGGGFLWTKFRSPEKLINRVEVFIPNPTAAEAVVNLQTSMAIQYYLEARMYLELLSQYDAENADPEEIGRLVDLTVTAFENADKISDSLSRSIDMWMDTDDVRDTPVVTVLQEADGNLSFLDLFMSKVFAKEKSASEVTAQQIVDAFDKAKFGNKVKAVAELLGTDNKHAIVQLKMAQASLEGADAMAVADQAETCIRVATTLKTAGTVAGLVIAAAPVATGAVATMATGELIVTGGGIVMGGINAGVELTSTGAMLYYGTEENVISQSAEKFQNSEFMKTANFLVNIGGVGYNIKNQIQNVNKLIDQADKIDDYNKLFTSLSTNNGKEASDLFGIMSYGLSSLESDDGTLVTTTPKATDNGMTLDIADTKIGTSPLQQEAMKKLLQESGYTEAQSELAVATAVEVLESGKEPVSTPDDPAAPVPEATIEKILEENKFIAPDNTEFNLDEFIDIVDEFMEVMEEYEVTVPLPTPSGNGQSDGSGTSADGDMPTWLNGFWVTVSHDSNGREMYSGFGYKFELIDDHTLIETRYNVLRDKQGYFFKRSVKPYKREYSVDPRTGTVTVHEGTLDTVNPLPLAKLTISTPDGDYIYNFIYHNTTQEENRPWTMYRWSEVPED